MQLYDKAVVLKVKHDPIPVNTLIHFNLFFACNLGFWAFERVGTGSPVRWQHWEDTARISTDAFTRGQLTNSRGSTEIS